MPRILGLEPKVAAAAGAGVLLVGFLLLRRRGTGGGAAPTSPLAEGGVPNAQGPASAIPRPAFPDVLSYGGPTEQAAYQGAADLYQQRRRDLFASRSLASQYGQDVVTMAPAPTPRPSKLPWWQRILRELGRGFKEVTPVAGTVVGLRQAGVPVTLGTVSGFQLPRSTPPIVQPSQSGGFIVLPG